MCSMIAFVYFIYVICKKVLKDDKTNKIIKIFIEATSKIAFVALICCSIYLLFRYIKNDDRNNNIMHFKNILIDKEFEARIEEMGKFIEEKEKNGKEVYILDVMSAIFDIPQGLYYKNYDMFNMGNFGKDGVRRNSRRYSRKTK